MKRTPQVRAFTLTELLTVITVISVLSGLLLPVLSRTREKARQAYCLSNLHQLGLAAQLYWDDHEGRAFRYRGGTLKDGDLYWFGWLQRGNEGERSFDPAYGALYPYLSGRGVDTCPSLNYALSYFKAKATGSSYGYGYNIALSTPPDQPAFQVSAIRCAAQLAILADSAQVNTFQPPASPQHPMLEEFYYISQNEPTTHFRHGKRANAVWADGHAEGQRAEVGTVDDRLPREMLGRLASIYLIP